MGVGTLEQDPERYHGYYPTLESFTIKQNYKELLLGTLLDWKYGPISTTPSTPKLYKLKINLPLPAPNTMS